MGFYFLYKVVRGDLRYWLNLPNFLSWLVSIIIRGIVKTVVDFTLIIHFRHPFDVGGFFWTANVVNNQTFCFLSIYFYGKYSDESEEEVVELLWRLVGGLFIVSMLNFGLFLKMINEDYIKTFFSPITGKQFSLKYFQDGETDDVKFKVFNHHRSFYESIEEELKTWLEENWERWEEEKEDWFNAVAISTVPSDLLPKKALSDMGGVAGRKASIVKMKDEKGKVGRESVRRGSDLKIVPTMG